MTDDTQTTELLPCPFCGVKAEYLPNPSGLLIVHDEECCPCEGVHSTSSWNTRTPPTDPTCKDGEQGGDELNLMLETLLNHKEVMPKKNFTPLEYRQWMNEKTVLLQEMWSLVTNTQSPIRTALAKPKTVEASDDLRKQLIYKSSVYKQGSLHHAEIVEDRKRLLYDLKEQGYKITKDS